MIDYSLTASVDPYSNNKRFINTIDRVFAGIIQRVGDKVGQQLEPLKEYPTNRAKHPFAFATPKSRRYYFYLVSTGQIRTDGYGYVRNGGFARSWGHQVEQSGDDYTISIGSSFNAAKWIVGDRQVPGHRNTGWKNVNPYLTQLVREIDDQVTDEYEETDILTHYNFDIAFILQER